MTRIAGGYLDRDGYIDGTFNTGFLKLSPDEKEKNLQIAKSIPFSDTNKNLKEDERRQYVETVNGNACVRSEK